MESITRRSNNDEYRRKLRERATPKKMSVISKMAWANESSRSTIIAKVTAHSNLPESKERSREAAKRQWQNPDFRKKMQVVIANLPKVSSYQALFYSILDDLSIKYYREYNDRPDDTECLIGPYHFDCVIPRNGRRTLLIEVNGEWPHKFNNLRDKQKASFIANNHSDKYELKCIWAHEFKCRDKVVELIKYWLDITKLELIDYKFKDIFIKQCPAEHYKLLFGKYHYLQNAGRGGLAYGGYLNDILIVACVFSPLIRQNLPYDQKSARELSRLCIHPRYQKKNLGSWFISRCIKMLDHKYTTIISYCDTTYNHDGAIYKASNFVFDGEVEPDYWYVDKDGWVMHKKTLYNHAINLHMTENEFANQYKYEKVYGKKKLRFICNRGNDNER